MNVASKGDESLNASKVGWNEKKEEQGQDRYARVDCFHITAKAE